MKPILPTFFCAVLFVVSCDEPDRLMHRQCNTDATVRDLRGLDGCSFVFELNDGTRLEPMRVDCIVLESGKPIEIDPLINFEYSDGKHVKIGYELMPDYTSFCVADHVVKITCLTEEEGQPHVR